MSDSCSLLLDICKQKLDRQRRKDPGALQKDPLSRDVEGKYSLEGHCSERKVECL